MHLTRLTAALFIAASLSAVALAAEPSGNVVVPMSPLSNSKENGTATLTQRGKDLQVVINLNGAPAAAQPAHIHPGTCNKLDPRPTYPLSNIVDGKSNSLLKNVSLSELTNGQFAINVHKSTSDLGTSVACGDISGGISPPGASTPSSAAPAASPSP